MNKAKANPPEEIETKLNTEITRIFTIIDNYGTNTEARQALLTLLADQQREAKVEVLKSLAKEMDSCNDCPKDEPPSLHILKRLAEGEHAVINKLEYKK